MTPDEIQNQVSEIANNFRRTRKLLADPATIRTGIACQYAVLADLVALQEELAESLFKRGVVGTLGENYENTTGVIRQLFNEITGRNRDVELAEIAAQRKPLIVGPYFAYNFSNSNRLVTVALQGLCQMLSVGGISVSSPVDEIEEQEAETSPAPVEEVIRVSVKKGT